jgi:hypothetical protein
MSSWHYAYFFPGPARPLRPAHAVTVFSGAGLVFDEVVYMAKVVDDEGHLEAAEESRLAGNIEEELIRQLETGAQLLVECRNRDLFFAVFFATGHGFNPHVMIGWSRRRFRALDPATQERYWQLLRRVARAIDAAFVAVINDPPDYWEDRFLDVDGQRVIEPRRPSGAIDDIVSVWVRDDAGVRPPAGVDVASAQPLGDGFTAYKVLPA